MPTVEYFTGFYTWPPFWADEQIDLDAQDYSASQFTQLMSEVIFSYATTDFRLRICKDGMIMLHVRDLEAEASAGAEIVSRPMEEAVAWSGRYLDCLNCLYLLLDSATLDVTKIAYFSLSEITNRDAFRVRFEDGDWKGEGIAEQSIASHLQMGRYATSYSLGFRSDARLTRRCPLQKEVFDTLFASFSVAVTDATLLKSLAEIAKSIAEFKVGNWDTSLVLAWFVCESQITDRWYAFLETSNRDWPDGSKRVSSDRRQALTGRDYPISVVSNLLELAGQLPFETFKSIDSVRRYRNKVVHRDPGFKCGPECCVEAIRLALSLTIENTGLSIQPNLTLSIRF